MGPDGQLAAGDGRAGGRWWRSADVVMLVMVVGLGAYLRARFMDLPMKNDEAITALKYGASMSTAVSDYSEPNNHIFHTVLVRATMGVAGEARWAVRGPAFVAGLAVVVMAYAAGWSMSGRVAGLIAAGLCAGSFHLVDYSAEARGYTMQAALFLGMVCIGRAILRTEKGAGRGRLWAGLVVCGALAMWTIPTTVYGLGAVVVWIGAGLAWRREWRGVRELGISCAAMGAVTVGLYGPALVNSGAGKLVANPYVRPREVGVFVRELPRGLGATWGMWCRDLPGAGSGAGGWALGVMMVVGLVATAARGRDARGALGPVTVVWCAMVVGAQRVVPFERVWLFLLPLGFVYAGAGVEWIVGLVMDARGAGARVGAGVVAIVVGAGAGRVALGREMTPRAFGTGRAWDAPALAGWVREAKLGELDRVLAPLPTGWPLRYELHRIGWPTWQVAGWKQPAKRAAVERYYVVVREGQDVMVLMRNAKLQAGGFEVPVMVRRFETCAVWEARAKAGAATRGARGKSVEAGED